MTDNAERQVREWAKKRNGDPLTPKDVVDLVLAVDADGENRHIETIERLDDVDERHISLCLRVSELEQTSIGCSERVKAFVAAEHDVRHTEHMASHHGPERRADDPPGSEFLDKRQSSVATTDPNLFEMLLGYKMLRRIVIVVALALLVWGVSYWADSCSRAHYWGSSAPAIVASPEATATP